MSCINTHAIRFISMRSGAAARPECWKGWSLQEPPNPPGAAVWTTWAALRSDHWIHDDALDSLNLVSNVFVQNYTFTQSHVKLHVDLVERKPTAQLEMDKVWTCVASTIPMMAATRDPSASEQSATGRNSPFVPGSRWYKSNRVRTCSSQSQRSKVNCVYSLCACLYMAVTWDHRLCG